MLVELEGPGDRVPWYMDRLPHLFVDLPTLVTRAGPKLAMLHNDRLVYRLYTTGGMFDRDRLRRLYRVAIAGVVSSACADPIVEMSLRMPADVADSDASCITAIEVRAIGTTHATDQSDFTRSCLELQRPAATYAELQRMIHGKIALAIPPGDLAGVTVRGFAGPSACDRSDETKEGYRPDFNADLVFYGKASYIGDSIDIAAVPNLKCPTTSIKVRVVDMLALVAAGSSSGCATAMSYADKKGWSGIGTIVPRLFGKGVDFFGNVSWAQGTNSIVQFDGMMQLVEPGQTSCLALAGVNETGANTAGVVGGASVCAAAGELETAAIDYDVWNQVDRTLQGTFPGILFGSVWTGGSPKPPVAGASVAVDAKHGKVVYIDPPDASGIIHTRSDQSGTGPSGLFILYSDAVVSAKVNAGSKTRTLLLGAPEYTIGGAMVVVP